MVLTHSQHRGSSNSVLFESITVALPAAGFAEQMEHHWTISSNCEFSYL